MAEVKDTGQLRPRLPEWLKVAMPGGARYMELKELVRGQGCIRFARRRGVLISGSAGGGGRLRL